MYFIVSYWSYHDLLSVIICFNNSILCLWYSSGFWGKVLRYQYILSLYWTFPLSLWSSRQPPFHMRSKCSQVTPYTQVAVYSHVDSATYLDVWHVIEPLWASLNSSVFKIFCPIVRPYVSCVLTFVCRKHVFYNHVSWFVLETVEAKREIQIQSLIVMLFQSFGRTTDGLK